MRALTERFRAKAQRLGRLKVSKVFAVDETFPGAWCFERERRVNGAPCPLPPQQGWLCPVLPGDGCESLYLGLCCYEGGGGWQLRDFSKTQYAHRHGWPHFLACHRRVISLLDFARTLRLKVEVDDEGGYWETRSEVALRAKLGEYDRMVAAMAGALKDAADAAGERVPAEIFNDARFERLEAEGRQELDSQILQALHHLPLS